MCSSISLIHLVILYLHLVFSSRNKNSGNCRLQRNSAIYIIKMSLCICLYKACRYYQLWSSLQWFLSLLPGKVHIPFNVTEKANTPSTLMHISVFQLENFLSYKGLYERQRKQAMQCLEEQNIAVYHMEDLPS